MDQSLADIPQYTNIGKSACRGFHEVHVFAAIRHDFKFTGLKYNATLVLVASLHIIQVLSELTCLCVLN